MELYFYDLKEEAQKALLDETGIKEPEDMNWDVFPIAIIETENMLAEKCEDVAKYDLPKGLTDEEILNAVKELLNEGTITQKQYDYIIEWFDLTKDLYHQYND